MSHIAGKAYTGFALVDPVNQTLIARKCNTHLAQDADLAAACCVLENVSLEKDLSESSDSQWV